MASRDQTRRKHWSEEQARKLLAEQAASGQTMTEFARRRGLWPQRLWRWKKRLSGGEGAALLAAPAKSEPAFLPMVLPRAEPEMAAEVELGSGVRVRLHRLEPGAARFVAQLWRALEGRT